MRRLVPFLLALSLLPSCAYMQTHKNVKELGRSYSGYKLDKPQQLFRSGNTWYVAATPAEYRLKHDAIHDNVFHKTHEPTMTLLAELSESPSYHALSDDTATILLRSDGYADNATLGREVTTNPQAWRSSLPSGTTIHPVKASIAGEASAAITHDPQPAELPLSYRLLSGLDFVFVDIPGTLLYNVAVPVILPFAFFHDFLSDSE